METTVTCQVSGRPFNLSENFQFVLRRIGELNPVLSGEPLPVPHIHPFELSRQMLAFGNHRFLFKTKSAVSQKDVLTRYDPALGTKVCSEDEFYDVVDNTAAGQPYDFSRSFFEQWREVFSKCLHHPRNASHCEDSEYVNGAVNLKSCYLCFAAFDSQDCLYCWNITGCRDCVDLYSGRGCELCYGCINLVRCYDAQNSVSCNDSRNIFGCFGCDTCQDCFGCVGLYRAQYAVFNEVVGKERYQEFLAGQNLASHSARAIALKQCQQFWGGSGFVPKTVLSSTNSTGAYIDRCEDAEYCWNATALRQCGYLSDGGNSTNSFIGVAKNADLSYCALSIDSTVNAFCYTVIGGRNNLYCMSLHGGCSDCFGSIGLNKKQFCILNREYSKEEYYELVPRIIAAMKKAREWGQWFPRRYSPHYYQESALDQYLEEIPLETARARGYLLKDNETVKASAAAISASELPDIITSDDTARLSKVAVACERTGKPFNYQKAELTFYLKNGVPIPRVHWNARMVDAITSRERMPAC